MTDRPLGDVRSLVGRLYDTYGASLYRYALMLLADPSAAEDAVQQVFASLLRRGASVTLDNEAHYLRRAVRNECYSQHRKPRLARLDEAAGSLLETRDGDGASIDERLTLERAIRALPIEQREVLHIRVYEGMTFQEIAGASGESINTVSSRYRYAVAKLREEYGGRSRD
jgi:RNA polymerase sigma-70 factor, ECF subfamily